MTEMPGVNKGCLELIILERSSEEDHKIEKEENL